MMRVADLARRFWLVGACSAAAFTVMFLTARSGKVPVSWNMRAERDSTQYLASQRRESGQQIVMVFVGAEWCGASTMDGMGRSILALKKRLSDAVRGNGWSFVTHGIALDWRWEDGAEFLRTLGEFDEVSIGGNWSNRLLLHYLDAAAISRASVPRIMVYRRILDHSVFYTGGADSLAYTNVTGEQLLIQKVGADEITQWADEEILLPPGWESPYLHGDSTVAS